MYGSIDVGNAWSEGEIWSRTIGLIGFGNCDYLFGDDD